MRSTCYIVEGPWNCVVGRSRHRILGDAAGSAYRHLRCNSAVAITIENRYFDDKGWRVGLKLKHCRSTGALPSLFKGYVAVEVAVPCRVVLWRLCTGRCTNSATEVVGNGTEWMEVAKNSADSRLSLATACSSLN